MWNTPKRKTSYPGSIAFYNTRPGNEVGLFCNAPEPAQGSETDPIGLRCAVYQLLWCICLQFIWHVAPCSDWLLLRVNWVVNAVAFRPRGPRFTPSPATILPGSNLGQVVYSHCLPSLLSSNKLRVQKGVFRLHRFNGLTD